MKKKLTCTLFSVLMVLTLTACGESKESRQEYIDNLQNFNTVVLDGAVIAETQCNLTKSVWYDTIYQELNEDTYKYTVRPEILEENNTYAYIRGYYTANDNIFNDDFNISLSRLYKDESTQETVATLSENCEKVSELLGALSNPSDEFASCFSTVEDLYSAHYNFTNLAISPSGSLQSFTEDFQMYDSLTIELYNKLGALIPD